MNWLCSKFNISKSSYYSRTKTRKLKLAKWDELDYHVNKYYHKSYGIKGYRHIYFDLMEATELSYLNVQNGHQILLSMQRQGIRSIAQKKKNYKINSLSCEAFKDLVNGRIVGFRKSKPNMVWYTDFTYQLVGGKYKYVCVIIDSFDGKVLSQKTSDHIDSKLACETLEEAIFKENPKSGLILHSDQGSQYRSKRFTSMCKSLCILQH